MKPALLARIASLAFAGFVSTADAAHVADVRFRGSSTLHDFEGSGNSAPFEAVLRHDDRTGADLLSARVSVPVVSLDTANDKRDRNMFRLLEQELFPVVDGEIVDAALDPSGETPVDLALNIHGTQHPVRATITDVRMTDAGPVFRLTFTVSLASYGLKPPSVMGLIRVADEVKVECDVHPVPTGASL